MKRGKIRFYCIFASFVMLFVLVKWAVPSVAKSAQPKVKAPVPEVSDSSAEVEKVDVAPAADLVVVPDSLYGVHPDLALTEVPRHKIRHVSSYASSFPDVNDVQLKSARKWGVKPIANREEAEKMKDKLVYVASTPYYHIDKLNNSIPYLVPRAERLLQDIGQAFHDSLVLHHMPLNSIRVTSVLRTRDDVKKLQRHNGNATTTSCHLFGTTFDICYNRYYTLQDPDKKRVKDMGDARLKFTLTEVLDDLRRQGRCHVKYEVHQGCYHVTVR